MRESESEIRKHKSVAIKNGKREKSKGKNHPLFQMCEGFYYSEHLFHLAAAAAVEVEEEKKEKRENFVAFPGSFSSFAHASFVDSTLQLSVCFINVVVHYVAETTSSKKRRKRR